MTIGLDPLASAGGNVDLGRQRASLGEYLGAVADDTWVSNAGAALMRTFREFDEALDNITTERAPGDPRGKFLSAEQASEQGKPYGLTFDRGMSEAEFERIKELRQRQLNNAAVFERARNSGDYGVGRAVASVATELLVSAADPVNVATAFLPIGQAIPVLGRIASPGARRLATGAVEGFAGAAAVQPIIAFDRARWDPDYGFGDVMADLAFGTVLGGGLHWAGGKVSDWRTKRASRQQAPDAPAADGQPPLAEPSAASIPQAMAEAIDATAPETRVAALRGAVAALAEDRAINVGPIVRSDPKWRAPEPATSRLALDAYRGDPAASVAGATRTALETVRAQQEAVASLASMRTAELRGEAWRSPVPLNWKPEPGQIEEAMRMARGLPPQRPLQEPTTLTQWLRARGGIDKASPDLGELTSRDLEKIPGLLRNARRQNAGAAGKAGLAVERVGDRLDYVMQAAVDAGFYPDLHARGEALDADRFLNDLASDAHGVRRLYREGEGDVVAWREQVQYFEATRDWLEQLGLDPKGMKPRDIAWIMSLDERRGRIEALAARVDRLSENESVELMDLLDDQINAVIADEMEAARRALLDGDPLGAQGKGKPLTLADLERLDGQIERFERDNQIGGRAARPSDGSSRAAKPAERGTGAADEGAADPAPGGQGREGEGQEGLEALSPADAVEALQKSAADPASDLQADLRAAERARADAEAVELDVREEVKAMEAAMAGRLDEADMAALELASKPHDETTLAVEALAQCRIGGGE